jgi:hypothetical protein
MKLSTLLLSLILPVTVFAQVAKVCLGSSMNVDTKCDCKKTNTCFKSFDKSMNVQVNAAEKALGEGRGKKLYAIIAPDLNSMDGVFSGTKQFSDFDIQKMEESSKKLKKVNNALLLRVEMAMKKEGIKNYRFKDRIKLYNSSLEKTLPPNVLDHVSKHGLNYNPFQDLVTGKNTYNVKLAQATDEDIEDQSTESVAPTKESVADTVVTEEKAGEASRFSEADLEKARRKKFAINDINKDRAQNLFSLITHRYKSVNERVGFKVVNQQKENFKKDQVLKEIFDTIDKM